MNWDLESAKKAIANKGGRFTGNQIAIVSPGIKVLGAIDYLVKQHKYIYSKEISKDDKK